MEGGSQGSPLRHCDHFHREEAASYKPKISGNEENAPENSLEEETLTKLQQRVIKKMRMGGTPYKQRSSRRFSSVSSVSSMNKSSFGSSQQQENQPLLLDTSTDNFSVTSSSDNKAILPHKESSKKNFVDYFGKQNKGNTDPINRHSISVMSATDKDPRFHSKRTLERAQKALEREERLSLGRGLSQSKSISLEKHITREPEMDNSQVFLAPVIGPPSKSSPWKEASTSSHPCSDNNRQSETNVAIAAAQEAPGLTATSSQDSSSSSAAPSTNTSSSASSMASDLVKRLVTNKKAEGPQTAAKARLPIRQGVRGTPVRIKPKVQSQDVQATDHGYASVSKLSAWLADDPTSTKKVRHVRRGANVISKSRQFEKDLEYVIAEENNISSGAVKERKNWLQTVFSGDCDDEAHHHGDSHHEHNHRHKMIMRTQPVDDSCARSEFVVSNDAASSISVSNQKKWLENAFKKEGQNFASKAKSDIGPLRESREDITARAKQMWQQKSEKRLLDKPPASAQKPPKASAASPWSKQATASQLQASRTTTPRKLMEDAPPMRASMGARTSTPTQPFARVSNGAASSASKESSRHSVAGTSQVEEDNAPVDFRAARELLIRRSKENGNELKVASKVQRRTDTFEKITKESKRRSSAMGLLKPTWSSDSCSDAPSDSYTKTYVENTAPKRSVDELP